jgi:hypothetical protein
MKVGTSMSTQIWESGFGSCIKRAVIQEVLASTNSLCILHGLTFWLEARKEALCCLGSGANEKRRPDDWTAVRPGAIESQEKQHYAGRGRGRRGFRPTNHLRNNLEVQPISPISEFSFVTHSQVTLTAANPQKVLPSGALHTAGGQDWIPMPSGICQLDVALLVLRKMLVRMTNSRSPFIGPIQGPNRKMDFL